jgi:hypothetical protein
MMQVMKHILVILLVLSLLSSCSSRDSAKLDSMLSVANSSTSKNLAKIASSSDPKSAAKALLEHKRDQWQRDPIQLAQDLKVAKHDFDSLMNALSGNVKKEVGQKRGATSGTQDLCQIYQAVQEPRHRGFRTG